MLNIHYGENKAEAEKGYLSTVEKFAEKNPEAQIIVIDPEKMEAGTLVELAEGVDLFSGAYLVKGRNLLDANSREFLLEAVNDLVDSPNSFVFLEGSIPAATIKKLDGVDLTEHSFSASEIKEKEWQDKQASREYFALGDALGKRDRKDLWIRYQDALLSGKAAEEIFWSFVRTVKNLMLVHKTKTAKEAGLHPYVYQKSEGFVKNYKEGELEKISRKLIDLYADTHRGKLELDLALERFILEV